MTASPIPAPAPVGRRLRLADPIPGQELETMALDGRAELLTAKFCERYGRRPEVLVAAPATVAVLGGPSWWDRGPALTAAVDRSALVAVASGEGARVAVTTDLDFPAGAGLGSRTAERVALRHALDLLGREDRLPWTPSELAARWGRPSAALLIDADTVDPIVADLTGFSLLALDTRLRHHGGDSALRDRHRALRRVTDVDAVPESDVEHRCLRHVTGERSRVAAAVAALTAGDGAALGRLMTASHDSLSTDLRTTTAQVDATVGAVLGAGAAGARMIGAGFGGSVLTLVPRGLELDVCEAATEAAVRAGFPRPRVVPLSLAGRVRRVR